MNKSVKLMSIAFLILAIASCTTFNSCTKDNSDTPTPTTGKANPELGIENVIPKNLGSIYTKNFNRYTKVKAPNGKAIHIVAQDQLTENQIVRCRSILEHYLKNYKGSKYGADKSAVANKMADNNAILCLLNGEDNGENPVGDKVTGQPLYKNEIQMEGHAWYMNQNYEHRDAAYEEILHFVHDNGIGVDENGKPSPIGALPEFQKEIRAAQKNALNKDLWGINREKWIKELTKENSLSQEYLASVVDSYYGLWGAWTESSTHGMWGLYVGKDREDIKNDDPMGYAIMDNKFFHPYITYNARIDAELNGNFSLKFNPDKPYTNHSRYLKDITLLGKNNNSVTVNEMNNNITGNEGVNTVILSGKHADYEISTNDKITTVTDKIVNRDGKNTLKNIEKLKFTDKTISL